MQIRIRCLALFVAVLLGAVARADGVPRIVGHRGLLRHAPENTLSGFGACMNLRLGFELDIRRAKDGVLVVMHDADVKRTTGAKGKVSDFTFAELRRLDAGRWFDPAFTGERVPTLDEVFKLLKERGHAGTLVCLDIKEEDETMTGEIVALAKKHGVLDKVVCIGLAIEGPQVRAKLRSADAKTPVAVLAPQPEGLAKALAEKNADWVYVRHIPSVEEVKQIHAAGKRVFLSGKLVAGNEPPVWRRAAEAGVDALLTDFPLECQQTFRAMKARKD
ncbi:MAG TPA: glycerophosphodiester phosphodiesterase family protein [Gemmataceae bacterium]|nr:glycerophosphodiester phosphodiesterase family protein [Gemmataceae bacterium]